MKRFIVGGLFVVSSFLGLGCNQRGTCIKGEGRWANCIVNATSEVCTGGQFFKEDTTAGDLRCKAEGFTQPHVGMSPDVRTDKRSIEEAIAKGELVHYKKSTP